MLRLALQFSFFSKLLKFLDQAPPCRSYIGLFLSVFILNIALSAYANGETGDGSPVITISSDISAGPSQSESFIFTANNATRIFYTLSDNAICDSNDSFGALFSTLTGTIAFSDESHNGKYVCAAALSSSPTLYQISAHPLNIDVTAPTVSITSDTGTLGLNQSASLTFTFSETVTGFTQDDISVTGGTLSGFSHTGTTATAIFTPPVESTTPGSISLAADQFTDHVGNGNLASNTLSLVIDTGSSAPVITISSDISAGPAQSESFAFTASDDSVASPPLSYAFSTDAICDASDSYQSYSSTLTLTDESQNGKYVCARATDDANTSYQISAHPLNIDVTAPTVSITSDTGTLGLNQSASLTFTFSETVTGFTQDDISVTGGTLSGFSHTGTTATAIFTPPVESTTPGSISLAADQFTDHVGNGNLASNTLSLVIDTGSSAPVITISSDISAGPAQSESFAFTASDDSVASPPLSYAFSTDAICDASDSYQSYSSTLTLTDESQNGKYVCARATDDANTSYQISAHPLNIDVTAPTVSITSDTGTLGLNQSASLTFTFSETVTGFTQDDISVTGGTLSGFSHTGTTATAIFTPPVESTTPGSISLAADQFTDHVGNGNLASNTLSLVIDTGSSAPVITISSDISAGPAQSESFAFTASDDSVASPPLSYAFSTDAVCDASDSYQSYSSTLTLTDESQNGQYLCARATDDANTSYQISAHPLNIDVTAPTVSITSDTGTLGLNQSASLTFTFSETVTGFTQDDISVTGGTLSGFSHTGTTATAIFTPPVESTTPGSISLAADQFTDHVGNGNLASNTLSLVIDTGSSAPVITISSDISAGPAQSESFAFTASDDSVTSPPLSYAFSTDAVCDASDSYQSYSSTLTLTDESQNGQYLCARATDDANTSYQISAHPLNIDVTAPTVSITSDTGTLGLNQSASLTFTFSETVTGFTQDDISVTGGTLSGFSHTGTTATAIFTPPVESTTPGSISLAADQFTDHVGNGNLASNTLSLVIDTGSSAPVITISSDISAGPAQSESFAFTASDDSVTSPPLSYAFSTDAVCDASDSYQSYSSTLTLTDESQNGQYLCARATDDANTSYQISAHPLNIDVTAPTVSITSDTGTLGLNQSASLTFTFSETVTGFTQDDISVTGGTLSGFSHTGTTATAIFTPFISSIEDGFASVAIGRFSDLAGNTNTASSELQTNIIINTVEPEAVEAQSSGLVALSAESLVDPTKGTPSFSWLQTSGQAEGYTIDISDPSDIKLVFSAPILKPTDEPIILVFTLQITYNQAGSSLTSTGNADQSSLNIGPSNVGEISSHVFTITIYPPDPAVGLSQTAKEIGETIASFQYGRANSILTNQPHFISRLRNTGEGHYRLNYQESDGDISMSSGNEYDMWIEFGGSFAKQQSGNERFGLASIGGHHFLNNNFMIGAMLQTDHAFKEENADASKISGYSRMVGPYLAGKIPKQPLFFEASFLYGQSYNYYTLPTGVQDAFDTNRWLARAKIEGQLQYHAFTLKPYLDVGHIYDQMNAFVNSEGTTTPEQTVKITQGEFGLGVVYPIAVRTGSLELTSNISGIISNITGTGFAQEVVPSIEDYRTKIELGLSKDFDDHSSLMLNTYYDGLGTSDFDSFGGSARYEMRF